MTQAWPADAVVRRPLASLVPYAKNARTHSSEQIAQLARLISAYGWTNPVLVDRYDTLIAGHGRVLAAQLLGLAEVPVMVADGWTAEQIKAYRLADNASAAQAGWDDEVLKFELGELDAAGFDLDLTGFDARALDILSGVADADGETDGGGGAGSYAEQYGVIVMCRDEAHQQAIFERLSADGLQVKVVAT